MLLLCQSGEYLAHLYWPQRFEYFEVNRDLYLDGDVWCLKATLYHGVNQSDRPTINFLAADEEFRENYSSAAQSRGLEHGILIERSYIEQVAENYRGYEFEEVTPSHPRAYGVSDPDEFWKFDIPQHRKGVLGELSHATVVRLATPVEDKARYIFLPQESIAAWW
jgi:hypothetical protein